MDRDFESLEEMRTSSADLIRATQREKLCKCRPDIRLQPYFDASTITPPAQTGGVHIRSL
jgi:hypothetical protein